MRYEIHKANTDDGTDSYYWLQVGENGETVSTSELFPSKSNAKRAAVTASEAEAVDEAHLIDKTYED